jgi:outer membrane protein TolC
MNIRRAIVAHFVIAGALVGPARAERYDLERCVDLALDASTQVGVSREQLQTARGSVMQSYGALVPNVTMNSWVGHAFIGPSTNVLTDAQGRPVQPAGFNYESYSFSLQSQVNLFDWGANFNGITRSQHDA